MQLILGLEHTLNSRLYLQHSTFATNPVSRVSSMTGAEERSLGVGAVGIRVTVVMVAFMSR